MSILTINGAEYVDVGTFYRVAGELQAERRKADDLDDLLEQQRVEILRLQAELAAARRVLDLLPAELLRRAANRTPICAHCPDRIRGCHPPFDATPDEWPCRRDAAALDHAAREREGER